MVGHLLQVVWRCGGDGVVGDTSYRGLDRLLRGSSINFPPFLKAGCGLRVKEDGKYLGGCSHVKRVP